MNQSGRIQELADLESHRIEGFAHQGGVPFSVPLYSQIQGNLWMGGCPRGSAPADIKFIVCLYPWEHYAVQAHQVFLQCQMFDEARMPDEALLRALARTVNAFAAAGPTLVHCQAGLNRSGLIAALSLIEGGMNPAAAIALLREKRCGEVLCNKTFERWLLGADRRAEAARLFQDAAASQTSEVT